MLIASAFAAAVLVTALVALFWVIARDADQGATLFHGALARSWAEMGDEEYTEFHRRLAFHMENPVSRRMPERALRYHATVIRASDSLRGGRSREQ